MSSVEGRPTPKTPADAGSSFRGSAPVTARGFAPVDASLGSEPPPRQTQATPLIDANLGFSQPLDQAPPELRAQDERAQANREVSEAISQVQSWGNPLRGLDAWHREVDEAVYNFLWEDPPPPPQPLGHRTYGRSLETGNLLPEKRTEQAMIAEGLTPTGDGLTQWEAQVAGPTAAYIDSDPDRIEPVVPDATRANDNPTIRTKHSATEM